MGSFTVYLLYILSLALDANASLLKDLRELKAASIRNAARLERALVQALPSEVEVLRSEYLESRAQADILDRLIFYTDSYYKSGDEREFLKSASLKLAENEVRKPEAGSGELWIFLKNFASISDKIRDSGQSAGALLFSYMKFSTVLTPKDPELFLKNLDYSNGVEFESAKNAANRDTVSDIVDSEIAKSKDVKILPPPRPRPVVITETIKTTETRQ